MSFRVLCDENVAFRTVEELEAEGHTATHVTVEPGPSSDDESVASFVREHDYVLLTNDDDFLTETWTDVSVLYFPDNGAPAHELAARVVELQEYYPTQADLPELYFLTSTTE